MKKLLYFISLLEFNFLFAQTPVFDGAIILDGTQNAAHAITNCFADPTGVLHVSGQFGGVCDFDPGPDVTLLNANNGYPCYVARYTNNLELIWAKLLIGNSDSTSVEAKKVLGDAAGNTIVAGHHANTFDADPGAGIHTLAGYPFTNSGFIVSLNELGDYNWSAHFGTATNHCRIYDMVQTSNGHLYFCGDFNDSIDFDPGPDVQLKVAAGNTSGSFVLELDNDGNFVNVTTWDNLDVLRCIDKDEFDNIYTGGAYSSATDFDPGPGTYILNSSAFSLTGIIVSIDTAGAFRWAGNFIDLSGITTSVVKDIAHANGILAVTGHFNNTIDVDPGPGTINLSAAGNYDHFHVGLNASSGSFVWGGRTGGTQVDDIRSITADQNGDFWINGISQGTVDLDLDPLVNTTSFLGANPVPWVMRLSNTGNLEWAGNQGGQFLNGSYDNSITTNNGAIYWMGNVSNNMDLDPIGNSFFTSPTDYYSAFITKLCLPVEHTVEFSLCPGDSLFVQGAWQTQAGGYTDIYPRINGCDSIVTTIIYIASLNISLGNDTAFCTGQLFLAINNAPAMQFLWNNGDNTSYLFIDSTGTYSVTVSSTNGVCAASDTINVIYGLAVDAIGPVNPLCLNGGNYPLPQGNPVGGTWSGPAVNNNVFDPLIAGLGNHWLYYSYTDTANCSGSDSVLVLVDVCTAIQKNKLNRISLQPNPANEYITIKGYDSTLHVALKDISGNNLPVAIDYSGTVSLIGLSDGFYFLQLTSSNNRTENIWFIKQK